MGKFLISLAFAAGTIINLESQCWKSVSCVEDLSLAIQKDGTLWAWGRNTGTMGFPGGQYHLKPIQSGSSSDWAKVFAGKETSFAIKNDGTLWGCGRNEYGQLGIGTNTINTTWNWTKVPSEIGWLKVSQGQKFIIGLKVDGSLWSWGYNREMVLGDGTNIDKNLPTRIGNEYDWLDIAAHTNYTIALKKDGSIWGWGQNDLGWIGDGTRNDIPIPIRIGILDSFTNISGGLLFQLLLKPDGSLWGWGSNSYGQLNDGSDLDKKSIIKINSNKVWKTLFNSSKSYSAGAITNQGQLYLWGANLEGQLGNGSYNYKQEMFQLLPQYKWISLCFSYQHGLYLTEDGYLFTSGKNLNGELGDGTIVSKNTPVNVPCEIINNNSTVTTLKPIIYPNPVNDRLIIKNVDLTNHFRIQIVDPFNNIIYISDLTESEINLINFNSGLYIVHIFNKVNSFRFKLLKI